MSDFCVCPHFFCYGIDPTKPGGYCADGHKCDADCDFHRRFETLYVHCLLVPDEYCKLDLIRKQFCYYCVLGDLKSPFDDLPRPARCKAFSEWLLEKRRKGEM